MRKKLVRHSPKPRQPHEHQPVLLAEVIENLAIDPAGIYIDATFGRGGHSQAILEKLNERGKLFALDQDPDAIEFAKTVDLFADKRFLLQQENFSALKKFAEQHQITNKVNGILFDLGVSSPQFDNAVRGFSFQHEGPLDMRMNPQQGISAAEWINHAKEEEIADVLYQLGEERYSRRIAAGIVRARQMQTITTTLQLAEIIASANPRWEKHKHPATRSFQAIRIFINQELEQIKIALEQSLDVLALHGRLAVISFHSLEDRIVKQFIQLHTKKDSARFRKIAKIKPTRAETLTNPRSRSALLRVVEKIA